MTRSALIQRLRVPLGFAAAIAALALAQPSGWSIALGFPIALAGLAFRLLAAGALRKNARLATGGPYAWTRNPLYFGSALLTAGFAIMSASAAAAVLLMLPSFVVYPNVIAIEEAHLAQRFPLEFPAFRASTPVFFPRFRPTRLQFSFAQYRANREYRAALGFAGAMAVFLLKCFWLPGR